MSNNLNIGVLFSAYNCAAYIDECIEPWLKLKKELNLVLAATNSRYILSPEEPDGMKGSHSLLKLLGNNLDFLLNQKVNSINFIQNLFERTNVGFFSKDINGKIISLNTFMLSIYGVDKKRDVIGKSDLDFLPSNFANSIATF